MDQETICNIGNEWINIQFKSENLDKVYVADKFLNLHICMFAFIYIDQYLGSNHA